MPQLQQGWIDENTTHVSLTITGNDFNFVDVVKACATNPTPPACESSINGAIDEMPEVRQRLVQIIHDIREAAPSAKIVLVGYPYIVSDRITACPIGDYSRRLSLRDAQTQMVEMQVGVVQAAGQGVAFADPRPAFADHEGVEWVNEVVVGSPSVPIDMASFHPKARGQYEYSVATSSTFDGMHGPK